MVKDPFAIILGGADFLGLSEMIFGARLSSAIHMSVDNTILSAARSKCLPKNKPQILNRKGAIADVECHAIEGFKNLGRINQDF
ncbi:MAG: hypothetical protein HC799_04495 [Limnothrix sp. RL_2_0]|nr:hypothetical protein [Limnothrix sp. RL_2_0]